MELNEYTHTLLAVGLMLGAYLLGRFMESRSIVENTVGHLLENLEKEGFIRTSVDKDGDKELIPISKIVAETVRDALSKAK